MWSGIVHIMRKIKNGKCSFHRKNNEASLLKIFHFWFFSSFVFFITFKTEIFAQKLSEKQGRVHSYVRI